MHSIAFKRPKILSLKGTLKVGMTNTNNIKWKASEYDKVGKFRKLKK